jgi:hypothetical protein
MDVEVPDMENNEELDKELWEEEQRRLDREWYNLEESAGVRFQQNATSLSVWLFLAELHAFGLFRQRMKRIIRSQITHSLSKKRRKSLHKNR